MVVVVCWTCVGHHCQCPVCLSVVVVLTDDFHRVVTVWVGGTTFQELSLSLSIAAWLLDMAVCVCVCLKSGGAEVGESVVTVWGTTFFRVVTIAAGACVERLFKLSPWVLAVFPPCTASLVTTLERLRLCSSIILADVCLPEKLQPTLRI